MDLISKVFKILRVKSDIYDFPLIFVLILTITITEK